MSPAVKNLLILAPAAAAAPPVVDDFTVDLPNPAPVETILFSYSGNGTPTAYFWEYRQDGDLDYSPFGAEQSTVERPSGLPGDLFDGVDPSGRTFDIRGTFDGGEPVVKLAFVTVQ